MTSTGVSSKPPWYPMPALQIITSSRPNADTASATGRDDVADEIVEPIGPPCRDHDRRTLCGKLQGGGSADAGGRSGNRDDFRRHGHGRDHSQLKTQNFKLRTRARRSAESFKF